MDIRLRDGSTTTDARLDRLPQPDVRNLQYPIRPLLTADQQKERSFTWKLPTFLDQGREGACVGFSITQELLAKPVPVKDLDAKFAREKIYWAAQQLDDWPGGAYPGATERYEGTSVLAGAKAATEAGYYTEYRWATTEEDMALAVGHRGPVVLGINWYESMMDPNEKGFLEVTGGVAGGHAILFNGINVKHDYYTLSNSWGKDWGVEGTARISRADVARLIGEEGAEVMVPVHRVRPTSPA